MSSTTTRTPTRSTDQFTEPTAPDYEVPDSLEAWERFNRLVGKVLASPKRITADEDNQGIVTNPVKNQ